MTALGPELDLGEAQWAVEFGDRYAHWFFVEAGKPGWARTTCGAKLRQPLLYHPGSYELCRHCASRHRAPSRRFLLSPGIVDWLERPMAPPWADRTYPNARY